MKKRITLGLSWIGWMLLTMGLIFGATGVLIAVFATSAVDAAEQAAFRLAFLCSFGGIGVILAIIGGVLLAKASTRRRRAEALEAGGTCAMADVVDITPVYTMNVNGRSPYILRCTYRHTDGQLYMLKSEYLRYNPKHLLPNNQVKVWIDPYDIKQYYVDVEGSLSERIVEL